MREDQKIFGEGGGGEHIAAFAKDRYIFYIYIYILWTRPRDASRDGFLRK